MTTSTQTTSSMPVDSDEDTFSPMEEDSDDDYAPSSSSSSSSCQEPLMETNHGHVDKFIVHRSCLLPLLKLMACSRCGEMESLITSTTRGTLLLAYFICRACEFKMQWNSQPYVGNTPAGNIALSTAMCEWVGRSIGLQISELDIE